jgi:hypothetical protein
MTHDTSGHIVLGSGSGSNSRATCWSIKPGPKVKDWEWSVVVGDSGTDMHVRVDVCFSGSHDVSAALYFWHVPCPLSFVEKAN